MYKINQGHLTVFCIVFVWLGGPPSPVRIMTQVPWFMYQNRLGPSGGIYSPNFVPCFVVLYLNYHKNSDEKDRWSCQSLIKKHDFLFSGNSRFVKQCFLWKHCGEIQGSRGCNFEQHHWIWVEFRWIPKTLLRYCRRLHFFCYAGRHFLPILHW